MKLNSIADAYEILEMSQLQLADLLGVHVKTLYHWEKHPQINTEKKRRALEKLNELYEKKMSEVPELLSDNKNKITVTALMEHLTVGDPVKVVIFDMADNSWEELSVEDVHKVSVGEKNVCSFKQYGEYLIVICNGNSVAANESLSFRQIRAISGLSQGKFCKKYGISQKTYGPWEREERKVPEYLKNLLEFRVRYDYGKLHK